MPSTADDGVEQAELRVEQVAPGQAHRDGRDHHRQDEQGAEEGHAAHVAFQRQRQRDAQQHLGHHAHRGEDQRRDE
jgi:hypothetical protein